MGSDFRVKVAIGQDSHRFGEEKEKPLILGGVNFSEKWPELPSLIANSDGDVVLHALTNAISGVTAKNILGKRADEMCRKGIKDSSEYLKAALFDLKEKELVLSHISFSIECKIPKIAPLTEAMREKISLLTGVPGESIGITATTGEELTPFGKGLGISVLCIVTAVSDLG